MDGHIGVQTDRLVAGRTPGDKNTKLNIIKHQKKCKYTWCSIECTTLTSLSQNKDNSRFSTCNTTCSSATPPLALLIPLHQGYHTSPDTPPPLARSEFSISFSQPKTAAAGSKTPSAKSVLPMQKERSPCDTGQTGLKTCSHILRWKEEALKRIACRTSHSDTVNCFACGFALSSESYM